MCEIVNCSVIDVTSCSPIYEPGPNTSELYLAEDQELDTLYDEEGCFYTDVLRETNSYKAYMKFSLWMGILTIVSGCFGLIGNVVNIVVLCSQDMRSKCFNNLLSLLNLTDSFHIVFAILEVLRYDFPGVYQSLVSSLEFYAYIQYPGYRISVVASIYMIISVGIERYLAVCRPHHFRQVQTQTYRALVYIIPALVMAVVVSLPRFVEVETAGVCLDLRGCSDECEYFIEKYNRPTELRMDKRYIIFYHLWFWIFATGIFPFIVLFVINLRIFYAMKALQQRLNVKRNGNSGGQTDGRANKESGGAIAAERRKKSRANISHNAARECNLAIILLSTTLTFFVLHTPRLLTSVYEAITIHYQLKCTAENKDFLPLWFLYAIAAMNAMLVLNASSNFLIYLFVGVSFRTKFVEIFRIPKCCVITEEFISKKDSKSHPNIRCSQVLRRSLKEDFQSKQFDMALKPSRKSTESSEA